MRFPYLHLLLIFLCVSISLTYMVKHDDNWSWIKTKYLTRSNWTSSLNSNTYSSETQPPVWFIFHYLSYCGFCKKAKPGWEASARYAEGDEFFNEKKNNKKKIDLFSSILIF